MGYQKTLDTLSQCGLGAVLVARDGTILEANETAGRLLYQEGGLPGKNLEEIAPAISRDIEPPAYENVAFGKYLIRCPAPDESLPTGTKMVVFRDGSNDACHDMLISIVNQLSEAVALFDEKGRIYFLNDAVVKMESMVTQDVLGERVSDVYRMRKGTELAIPQVLHTHRPLLNFRQHYTTQHGKDIDVVTNAFPIVQNGQVLGAFTVMEDWSRVSDLHRQIIELQAKLIGQTADGKYGMPSALTAKYCFEDISYTSKAMGELVRQCRQIAKGDSSVMIYGETGTGKELFAQSIHNASPRADRPFLAINCAAIPENLLEGILFGTEKGAYTGAERRPGLFEQADSGTLLLDELTSMNINLQSKLLRVLQEGTFRRVGGSVERRVNVRIISNVNIPPLQAIAENRLRQDLFYRLGVVNLTIPPLRMRKEDIPLLSRVFMMQLNRRLQKNVQDIDQDTLGAFQRYDWPGNVRELQHAIEYAMNILPDDFSVITPKYLPDSILNHRGGIERLPTAARGHALNHAIHDVEYNTVCRALRASKGNISEAARNLGLSRQSLQYRIRRYHINVHDLCLQPEAGE